MTSLYLNLTAILFKNRFKGAICKNWPPVEFTLNTNRGAAYHQSNCSSY